jgi:sirohydrochlorin ferrochelatase
VGWRPGDAVVMAAAGSSDSRAHRELRYAAALLAQDVGPVQIGFVATGAPRLDDVVSRLRAAGRRRVFIASYLLAPGLFHDRLADCDATEVAAPLGMHPRVVDLVVARAETVFRQAATRTFAANLQSRRSERVADVA